MRPLLPHNEGKADVAIEAGASAAIPEDYNCWAAVTSHLFLLVVFPVHWVVFCTDCAHSFGMWAN